MAGRPAYDVSGIPQPLHGLGLPQGLGDPDRLPRCSTSPTFAGGLTPVRQVGSMQSMGLAMKGADGRSYTFRTT